MPLPTLTIGQVAGIINAAIVVAHLTFPLIMVFIVVGILKDTNNAATWSVLGGLLNSSKWPRLLSTDSAMKRKVSKRVLIPSTISSLGLLFLGVVSSVTPLGLSSSIAPASPQAVQFQYTQDNSPIGEATTTHIDYTTNRLCGFDSRVNCPGSAAGYDTFENSTGWYGIPTTPDAYISSVIASNITEAFTSATSGDGNTISSVFDIQYRNFIQYNNATQPGANESEPWIDQGRPRSQGQFQFYQSLILENRYLAVEGVVLDLISGGIGFRNHTLPPSSDTGFAWEEDLLWIEPDSICVNLNVTVDYAIKPLGGGLNARLTDRGGIANLPKDYPVVDLSNTQDNPALYDRAWVGAVLTNYNFMIYFNETRDDLSVGKTYSLEGTGTFTDALTPTQFSIVAYGDNAIGPTLPPPLTLTDFTNSTVSDDGTQKYMDIGIVTQGFGQPDNANITTIMAATGLILGAGSEVDASGNLIVSPTNTRLDPLTNWSQPLYSCASALKASVKRVSFQINGTASISNLVINSIEPVTHSSSASTPLWAVENTSLNVADVSPFWGLISSEYSSSPSLYTIQKEFLYLPAGMGAFAGLSDRDGAAGAMAPAGALFELFNGVSVGGSTELPDYSGKTNYPTFLKWKELSSNTSTVSAIPNLIWTDLMANSVLGSKSQLSRNGTAPLASTLVSTTPFRHVIEYNYLYAIPAFCFLVLYVLTLLISLIFFLIRRVRISTLRMLLNQTSAGRAVTTERHGQRMPPQAPTAQWVDMFGDEEIRVKKSMADQKYQPVTLEAPYSPYQQPQHEAWDMQKMPSESQVRLNPA